MAVANAICAAAEREDAKVEGEREGEEQKEGGNQTGVGEEKSRGLGMDVRGRGGGIAGESRTEEGPADGENSGGYAGKTGGVWSKEGQNHALLPAEAESKCRSSSHREESSVSQDGGANLAGNIASAGAEGGEAGAMRVLEGAEGFKHPEIRARKREEERAHVLRQFEALKHAMKNLAADVSALHAPASPIRAANCSLQSLALPASF